MRHLIELKRQPDGTVSISGIVETVMTDADAYRPSMGGDYRMSISKDVYDVLKACKMDIQNGMRILESVQSVLDGRYKIKRSQHESLRKLR